MKTRIGILVVLCTVLSCTSAGKSTNEATTEKQNREVGSFQNIETSTGITVYFAQEQTQSIRVETENIDGNEVVTEVKGKTLVIKMKSNNSWGNNWLKKRSVKVYVSAPVLEGIDISSGSNFNADNLKSTNFTVSSSSGSNCNITNLKANSCDLSASSGSNIIIGAEISGALKVDASSGSNINLSGKANTVRISASSGSNVDVRNLQHEQIDSNASSGASVHK